jgi:hypothetical protein
LSDAADVPVTILLSRRRKSWENAVAFRVEEMIQTAVEGSPEVKRVL